MQEHGIRTLRGSIALSLGNGANLLLGLLFFGILTRFLAKDQIGVFAGFELSYSLFAFIAGLGLRTAATRFVSAALARNRPDEASASAKTALGLGVLASVGMGGIHYLSASQLSLFLVKSSAYTSLFQLISIAVIFAGISNVQTGIAQGGEEYGRIVTVVLVGQLANVAGTWLLLVTGYGLVAVVWGTIIMEGLQVVLLVPLLMHRLRPSSGLGSVKGILEYTAPVLAYNLVIYGSRYIDLFFVLLILGNVGAGTYNLVLTGTGFLTATVLNTFWMALLPGLTRVHENGDEGSLSRAVKVSTRYVSMTFLPLTVGLASISEPFVRLLGARGYGDAVLPLAIISLASFAFGLVTPLRTALEGMGQNIRTARALTISVIVDALVSVLGIPYLGVTGAALARTAFFLAALLLVSFEARGVFKVSFDVGALGRSSIAAGAMAGALILIQRILGYAPRLVAPYVVAGGAVYLLVLYAIGGISRDDINRLRAALPRRIDNSINAVYASLT